MAKFVLIARTVVEEMLSKLGSGHKLAKTFRANQETYKSALKKGFTRLGPKGGRTSKTLEGLNSGRRVAMPRALYDNMTKAAGVPAKVGTLNVASSPRTPSKSTARMWEEVGAANRRRFESTMAERGMKLQPRRGSSSQIVRDKSGEAVAYKVGPQGRKGSQYYYNEED